MRNRFDLRNATNLALELDGVMLQRFPWQDYYRSKAASLARRHSLEPLPNMPMFTADQAMIITARPNIERDLTRDWLERHGFGDLYLVCRPCYVGEIEADLAHFKAETAKAFSCSHFIESDHAQAMMIAAGAPEITVFHWDAETSLATHIPADVLSRHKPVVPTLYKLPAEFRHKKAPPKALVRNMPDIEIA